MVPIIRNIGAAQDYQRTRGMWATCVKLGQRQRQEFEEAVAAYPYGLQRAHTGGPDRIWGMRICWLDVPDWLSVE